MSKYFSYNEKSGSPYLLLSDSNERGYSTNELNWEHFTVSAIIKTPYICMASNTRGHHTSPEDQELATSFIYLLSHHLWITTADNHRNSLVGSMGVYSSYELKNRKNFKYTTSIFAQSILPKPVKNTLKDFIINGNLFYLTLETEQGVKGTFFIDLPMVNEAGEFKMNIKPFIGLPGAILNSEDTSNKMKGIIDAFGKSPNNNNNLDFWASPREIEENIQKRRENLPSAHLDFSQKAFSHEHRPSLICLKLKEGNTSVEIHTSYKDQHHQGYSRKLKACDIHVCS